MLEAPDIWFIVGVFVFKVRIGSISRFMLINFLFTPQIDKSFRIKFTNKSFIVN